MRNFIRHNIDNVKGRKAVSIQRQNVKISQVKRIQPSNFTVNHRVGELEKRISELEKNRQEEIIQQLSSIREDIRLIKSHIFQRKFHSSEKQITQDSAADDEAYNSAKQRLRSQNSQFEKDSKVYDKSLLAGTKMALSEMIQGRVKKSHSTLHKNSLNIKTISSMTKQYKFDEPQYGTLFYGYSKRNSQLITLKYSPQGLGGVLQVYDRLWKNIAKAKWPCVNRIIDFKREDSTYMIMQRNKGNIVGLPPKPILIDILKILEFIHDCGYLYRNIEPEHFMINQDGQLVVIDFKRAKRYVDIKGHPLEITDSYTGSPFASNNQLRGLPQSRKDDLQSLGYIALLLLELEIPWLGTSKQQAIKIRCSLTLQQLYKQNMRWVQYMATVMKMPKNERPDYKRLIEILQLS